MMTIKKMLKNIRCLFGLHKYDKKKSRSSLIREGESEYDFCIEDVCENCGKVRHKIVVAK